MIIRTPLYILIGLLLISLNSFAENLCEQSQSAWIFCDDFESNDLQLWDPGLNPEYVRVIGGIAYDGRVNNRVLELRVKQGRGGSSLNKTFAQKQYRTLYARWYMKYEQGFDFTARNHGGGFFGGDRSKKGISGVRPKGDDRFQIQFEHLIEPHSGNPVNYIYAYYRGMTMDCSDPEGRCWGDHFPCMIDEGYYCKIEEYKEKQRPPFLHTDRWYCMEIMLDAGSAVDSQDEANGRLNFWVDGIEIGPWNNIWFRTSESIGLNHFWLGLFHHEEHSEQGILYDDVIISEERITCLVASS